MARSLPRDSVEALNDVVAPRAPGIPVSGEMELPNYGKTPRARHSGTTQAGRPRGISSNCSTTEQLREMIETPSIPTGIPTTGWIAPESADRMDMKLQVMDVEGLTGRSAPRS